jgi:hypothetical protein
VYKRSRPVGPSRSDSFLDTCPTVLVPLVGRVAPTRRAAATRRSERVIPAGPKLRRRGVYCPLSHITLSERLVDWSLRFYDLSRGVAGDIVAASAARIALRPAESSAAALDLAASASFSRFIISPPSCWSRSCQKRPQQASTRARTFGGLPPRLLQPLHHLPALMLVEELPEGKRPQLGRSRRARAPEPSAGCRRPTFVAAASQRLCSFSFCAVQLLEVSHAHQR